MNIYSGANVTFYDSVSVDDDLDISNATVNFSGGLFVDDNVDIGNSTVSFHGNTYMNNRINDIYGGSTINIYDNFYVKNNLENYSSTINNYGTLTVGEDFISSGSSAALNNYGTLNITDDLSLGSGTYTNSGTINVTDKFTISSGTMTSSGTINAQGDMTVSWGATLNNSGTINASSNFTNYKNFSNTGTVSISGNFTNGWSATLTNNGDMTVNGDFTNNNDITVGSGGNMTVYGEFLNNWSATYTNNGVSTFYDYVTNYSSFTNSDSLVLYTTFENKYSSSSLSNTGDIILNSDTTYFAHIIGDGNVSGTGDAVVKLYLQGNKWHYISSPIDSASSNLFWGCALYYYDAENDSWVAVGPNEYLEPLKGYDVYCPSDRTIVFRGTLNEDSYTNSNITNSGSGYHLVGNPYMSAIDWDKSSGWTKTRLANSIYVWDPETQNVASYVNGVGTNGGTRYIAPMQGFFIKNDGTGTGKLGTSRSIWARITSFKFRNNDKSASENVLRFKVKSLTNGYSDETVVRFNNHATDKYDNNYDATKMFSFNNQVPQIYTRVDSTDLSINSLKEFDNQKSIPLYVQPKVNGTNRISVKLENFPTCYSVYLEDTKNGVIHDLMTSPYEYQASVDDKEDRFVVHFINPAKINDPSSSTVTQNNNDSTTTTSIDEGKLDKEIQIVKTGASQIRITTSVQDRYKVEVFSLDGRRIQSHQFNGKEYMFPIRGSEGIYIIKVTGGKASSVERISIGNSF